MKIKNYALTLLVLILGFYSCGSDDDDVAAIVIIDRDVQYMEDLESIEEFLSTHYLIMKSLKQIHQVLHFK